MKHPHFFAAVHFWAAAVALVAVWKVEDCHYSDAPVTLWGGGEGVFTPKTTEQQSRGFAAAGVLASATACWFRPSKAVILLLLGGWTMLHSAASDLLRQTCPQPGRTTVELGAGAFAAYVAAAAGGWAFAFQ